MSSEVGELDDCGLYVKMKLLCSCACWRYHFGRWLEEKEAAPGPHADIYTDPARLPACLLLAEMRAGRRCLLARIGIMRIGGAGFIAVPNQSLFIIYIYLQFEYIYNYSIT